MIKSDFSYQRRRFENIGHGIIFGQLVTVSQNRQDFLLFQEGVEYRHGFLVRQFQVIHQETPQIFETTMCQKYDVFF